MTEESFLLTFAQIAATLVGFAALATVIKPKSHGDGFVLSAIRLQAVIASSILLLIASILPIIIFRYGFSADESFRISSIATIVINWFTIFVILKSGKKSVVGKNRAETALSILLEIIAEALLFTIAFGFFLDSWAALYFSFLGVGLVHIMLLFYVLFDFLLNVEV
jgi:hypothetical protein